MTNPEFSSFLDQLFVAFPSLFEWMKGTYKPEETQRLWRSTLRGLELAECVSVITRWSTGVLDPFEAYERDKVHLIVRAIVARDRDKARKRQSTDEMNAPYRYKRSGGTSQIGTGSILDATMAAAVKEGAAEHKKLLDGEIAQSQYESVRAEILRKHGIVGSQSDAKSV